jgi:hypothetical protein
MRMRALWPENLVHYGYGILPRHNWTTLQCHSRDKDFQECFNPTIGVYDNEIQVRGD